jgi:hypothetical protein
VLGALILVVLAASAEAEMKPIDPLAAESPPVSPPSAFAAPSTAQQSPGAFSGIFGWVLRTQQSLQRDLATGPEGIYFRRAEDQMILTVNHTVHINQIAFFHECDHRPRSFP